MLRVKVQTEISSRRRRARHPTGRYRRSFRDLFDGRDAETKTEGVGNQVRGAAQDVYGTVREGTADVADATTKAARDTASSFEKALRNTIENQPYTAVAIALALGWLFGRTHRPF